MISILLVSVYRAKVPMSAGQANSTGKKNKSIAVVFDMEYQWRIGQHSRVEPDNMK